MKKYDGSFNNLSIVLLFKIYKFGYMKLCMRCLQIMLRFDRKVKFYGGIYNEDKWSLKHLREWKANIKWTVAKVTN